MEAFILIVVMHCGVVEAVIKDTPTELAWDSISEDERPNADAFIKAVEASGARVLTIKIEDPKCAVST